MAHNELETYAKTDDSDDTGLRGSVSPEGPTDDPFVSPDAGNPIAIRTEGRTALRLAKTSSPGRSSYLRRAAIRLGVALTCALAVMSFTSAAFAGTGWVSAGLTGNVVEASLPAQCYNMSNGYYVAVAGPSVYGFTRGGYSIETAEWQARLFDATTNTYSAWTDPSPWYYVTASSGINFNSPRVLLKGIHGHKQYVQVLIEWADASVTTLLGYKYYFVSTYGTPYGVVSYCSF